MLTPVPDPDRYRGDFTAWWRQYTGRAGVLGRRDPTIRPWWRTTSRDARQAAESALAGAAAIRDLARPVHQRPGVDHGDGRPADQLPAGAVPRPGRLARGGRSAAAFGDSRAEPEIPEAPADVQIEPISDRVPSECLYVRFGSFANFLWFQDTLAQWRGDLENLVASRGLDYDTSGHFQKQLAVETTTMARLLGGTLVDDVAIIGTDLFFREGGAYGLLFLARNSMLLGADFNRQRQDRVRNNGCTESKIQLAGHEVSYLSSPDGGTRSFYATDGDYHCITTSRWIAQRFLETRSGQKCLSRSKEFRYARSLMRLSRNDTVFAYLSSDFFANLVGPRYRIEGMRRMQAEADIELVQLALLAAAAEKKPGDSIEQLRPGEFLPPGFGPRADGSRTVLAGGQVRDSLRGTRGFFTPVPDVEISAVSPFEAAAYERFSRFCREKWQRLDPVMAGIQRLPGDKGASG